MSSETQLEYRIAEIFDIHFGAKGNETIERQLMEVAMPAISEFRPHLVVQYGDLCDRRLNLDSDESKAAHRFVSSIVSLGAELGAQVRFIHGTMSHDHLQQENWLSLTRKFPNFRIIFRAEHETVLPDFDVLWVPEEYPEDAEAYYNQFLLGEDGDGLVYDGIMGHGEIDFAARWSSMNGAERPYAGAPVFEAAKLLLHSSGPVSFGHIHTRCEYGGGRMAYGGSFSRWIHGEESPKGMYLTTIRKTADGWSVERRFVENTLAPVYETVDSSELIRDGDTAEAVVAAIREHAAGKANLKVRFEGTRLSPEDSFIVRNTFFRDPGVTIEMPALVISEQAGDAEGDAEVVDEAAFAYLRDKGIPPHERLHRYILETVPEAAALTPDDVIQITSPAP